MNDDEFFDEVAGISNDYQLARSRANGETSALLDKTAHRCMAELKALLDQQQERRA